MSVRIAQSVARAVGAGQDPADACARAVEAIGEELGLDVVAAWAPSAAAPDELRCQDVWSAKRPALEDFARLTRSVALGMGEGLPGAVWESGEARWIQDAAADQSLPRRTAVEAAGLHAAICFPISTERGPIGAVEGFSAGELEEPGAEVLEGLEVVGGQLGQLIERRRAEESGVAVELRHQATLDASLDCVITMDHSGEVLEFNPAAERTFGYSGEEAVGREMAELIIPPDQREAHRTGLRRYLDGGDAVLLDRRIEVEAARRDGSRFPVELTITRIDVPGEPVFTGHLRDITERLRVERELRESRARLVEASDTARRRIERDLHDGAQQQLISVAMTIESARSQVEDDPAGAAELLGEAAEDLRRATSELRELARGIHPAVLTEGGLDPALRGLAGRSAIPVTVRGVPAERFPAAVEAAAYFVAAEAMANAARHAAAGGVVVEVKKVDGRVAVEVRDDGQGGAEIAGGGLRGLADRVSALGGELRVASPPGEGTTVRAEIPCGQ